MKNSGRFAWKPRLLLIFIAVLFLGIFFKCTPKDLTSFRFPEPIMWPIDNEWYVILRELQDKEAFTEQIELVPIYLDTGGGFLALARYNFFEGRYEIGLSQYAIKNLDVHGKRGLLAHELEHHVLGHTDPGMKLGYSLGARFLKDISCDRRAIVLIGEKEFKKYLSQIAYSDEEAEYYIRELQRLMPIPSRRVEKKLAQPSRF